MSTPVASTDQLLGSRLWRTGLRVIQVGAIIAFCLALIRPHSIIIIGASPMSRLALQAVHNSQPASAARSLSPLEESWQPAAPSVAIWYSAARWYGRTTGSTGMRWLVRRNTGSGRKHHQSKKEAAAEAAEKAQQAKLRETVQNLISIAEGAVGTAPDWPLMLHAGERLVAAISGLGLFEPRRGPGHYQGRSAGVSVPVGGRLRVRLGQSAGTFVQGDENPTLIDTGNVSITAQRVVFQGEKYTREWDFSKLIGVMNYTDHSLTGIQVSNRQKTSGIAYGQEMTAIFQLSLTVAIALYRGEDKEILNELQEELARLDAKDNPGGQPSVSN